MRSLQEAILEGTRIVQKIEAEGGNAARFLLPLRQEDYAVVGVVIQWTANGLFAAQQLIDAVEEARGEPIRPVNKSLRDNEVIPLLLKYVSQTGLSEDERTQLQTALIMIQNMTDIRHHMAHMSLRRHPNVDALIGLSLRRRENFRKANITPKYGQAMVAFIPIPEVIQNFGPLERNVNYVASLYEKLQGKA